MIKDSAKKASLENTEARVAKVSDRQQVRENRTTLLVNFAGFDPARGKAYGETLEGGTVYFDIESTNTPAVGNLIEVAIAADTNYGRGDLRPVK